MTTECCGVEIASDHRFCSKCGYEARAAEGLASSPRVDLENQRRQLEALGLLGEFAPSCDIADHLGEALLRARAEVSSPARPQLNAYGQNGDTEDGPEPTYSDAEIAELRADFYEFVKRRNVSPEVMAMVCPWLAEGAVSAAPPALEPLLEKLPTFSVKVYQNMQDVSGHMIVTVELSAVRAALADLARLRAPREETS